jgi:sRNA-binding regulator protein Hfq
MLEIFSFLLLLKYNEFELKILYANGVRLKGYV